MTARSYELQMLDLFRLHFFGSRRSSRIDTSEISPNQIFVLSELVRRDSPSLDELKEVLKQKLLFSKIDPAVSIFLLYMKHGQSRFIFIPGSTFCFVASTFP